MHDSVAVVHGNYLAHGGGEVVAEGIAETFDAPIYYGFGDPDTAVPDSTVEHRCLFEDVPGVFHRYCDRSLVRDAGFFLYGEHLPELAEYDVLIFSGNEFAWYPPPDTNIATVRYVHSPPRGAFDQFQAGGGGLPERLVQKAIRTLFEPTNTFADHVIANSEVVQKRCRRAFGREASVVYPPVDTSVFEPRPTAEREDYYVTLSRLSENKRLDEVVKAFTQLDLPLKVAGTGPLREDLEAMAGPNVEFLGYVSEAEKRDLLEHARAFVFNAREEDFGIVPVEAMAAGSPVLGVGEGFTAHQVVDGWNGYTYPTENRVDSLREAVDGFERAGVEATAEKIGAFATEHFDSQRFRKQLREEVTATIQAARVDVPWDGEPKPEPAPPTVSDEQAEALADGGRR